MRTAAAAFAYCLLKTVDLFSPGSLYETKTWLTKAQSCNLISQEEFSCFINEIKDIGVKLNNYLTSIKKLSKSNHD